MKHTLKKITALALVIVLALAMAACGNSDGGFAKTGKMTLEEYISRKGTNIIFMNGETNMGENHYSEIKLPAKDDTPFCLYVFRDGKVTMMTTELTWGDISKMSDEEIISKSTVCEGMQDCEYRLVVLTDNSGNETKYETIAIKDNKSSYDYPINCINERGGFNFFYITSVVESSTISVYDAEFSCMNTRDAYSEDFTDENQRHHTLWIKQPKNGQISLSLDTPKSENVIVDPEIVQESYDESSSIYVPTMDIFSN